VADKGLKKSLYTSARLKKGEVIYLETHFHRYDMNLNDLFCFTLLLPKSWFEFHGTHHCPVLVQPSTGTSCALVERSLVVLDQTPMQLMLNLKNTRTVVVTIHKMGIEALWNMNFGMCSGGLAVRRPCLKVPCAWSVSHFQQSNLRYFYFLSDSSSCSANWNSV
jgi:hypothetical protein